MSNPLSFEDLINLYLQSLSYTERATNEALSADDALTYNHTVKAEQHFNYAKTYRQKAQETLELFHKYLETMPNPQATFNAIYNEIKLNHPEKLKSKSLSW